jgi:hypothetical protein
MSPRVVAISARLASLSVDKRAEIAQTERVGAET